MRINMHISEDEDSPVVCFKDRVSSSSVHFLFQYFLYTVNMQKKSLAVKYSYSFLLISLSILDLLSLSCYDGQTVLFYNTGKGEDTCATTNHVTTGTGPQRQCLEVLKDRFIFRTRQ